MKEITVKVTNEKYFAWLWLLRRRYQRDKRTSLATLVKLAVQEIVMYEGRAVYEEVSEL